MPRQIKPPTHGRSGHKLNSGIEWIGGTALMPAYVTGEGMPYRPELLCWMDANGKIVGTQIARPGELLGTASESLQQAIQRPMYGAPHSPTRIRVSSTDLAAAIRAGHPRIEVVIAPTPELDEMLAAMSERFAQDAERDEYYLSPGLTPDAMSALFKAAAALFRVQPWKLVPNDQSLFSVTIEELGIRDAALSVIGQMGESLGLILFSSLDDFEAYLDAADVMALGEEPEMPHHFTLNFERGAQLAPAARKEVAKYHWEVAGPNAYPWMMVVEGKLVARAPTAKEVTIAEAIALALTHMLAEKKALRNAWKDGLIVTRTLSVATHAGEIEVTLSTPYMRARIKPDAIGEDVLAKLTVLSRDDGEAVSSAREPLEAELLRRFAASPEARDVDRDDAIRMLMDLGAHLFGQTIATLDATDLRELLFESIPSKVSIPASEAAMVIQDLRAFYSFLKREFGLTQADSCLRALGRNATPRLEAALSDTRNFGLAKSLMIAGAQAGFDMQSKDGIEAWMRSMEGKPLPAWISLPGAPPPASKTAGKAKTATQSKTATKTKRASASKAKRNR